VISHFPFIRILTFKIVICQTLKASVLLCNQASLSLIKISVITSQYLLRVKPETSEEASCSHYLGSSRYFIVTKKDKGENILLWQGMRLGKGDSPLG